MARYPYLHFYLLSLPDYIPGLPMAPWLPGWDVGRRLDPDTQARLTGHFLEAITMRRNAHEMGAIYGGKLPHTPAYILGGFTAVSTPENQAAFGHYLDQILTFIEAVYLPDAELLASLFSDYFSLGRGYGNLLSFGVFELDNQPAPALLLHPGRIANGTGPVLPADPAQITEHVRYSWYAESDDNLHPAVADTRAQHPKADAYSWLKAPRYAGAPCECGPLARMTITGDYANGVSVMDRHLARAREALKIARAMRDWLAAVTPGLSGYTHRPAPTAAAAAGLTEAPRGALGHWLEIADGRIAHYQVITPTCWNVSPKDRSGQRGPLEEALIGLPVNNAEQPIEVLRVVHSFDPCLDCATHVSRVEPGARVFAPGPLPNLP